MKHERKKMCNLCRKKFYSHELQPLATKQKVCKNCRETKCFQCSDWDEWIEYQNN